MLFAGTFYFTRRVRGGKPAFSNNLLRFSFCIGFAFISFYPNCCACKRRISFTIHLHWFRSYARSLLFRPRAGYSAPRYSSGHDDGSSFQGSVAGGSGLGPNPNSVFDDSGSTGQSAGFPLAQQQHPQPPPQQIATYQQIGQPVQHVVGAPRAIFDEDESGAREPPPLMKRTSRSALPSVDSRGWCFFSFALRHVSLTFPS